LCDCYNCGGNGHLSKDCPASKKKIFNFGKKKQEKKEDEKDSFALNLCSLGDEQESKNVSYPPKIEWILDSGCGRHLTGCSDLLGENADEAGTHLVLPDGTKTKSIRKGSIEMTTKVGPKTLHLTVHEVEYVPGFKRNLLSLVALEKRGINYRRNGNERYLISQCGTKLAKVIPEGDVLILRGELS
jgi:hypothetical protein